MFKKILRILGKTAITFAILLVIVSILAVTKVFQVKAMIAAGKNRTMPSESVTTVQVEKQMWNSVIKGVGDVMAVQGVTVTTETPGKVVKILFESGVEVEADQILLELDASIERAQLNSAVANAELAKINVARARELFEKTAIAKSELDTAEARFSDAEAQVQNLKAVLQKKVIRAPFSGRLGIRQVNLGQFVGSGQSVVSLQSIDPVYVDFYIPQQKLPNVAVGYEVNVTTDAVDSSNIKGEITAIASEVDSSTRNVLIRATLRNESGILRPGMFVEARILQPQAREVFAIPSTAILYAPYGDSIFVTEKADDGGLVANQRFVRLGESRGDYVEIMEGIKEGEEVVTTGAFKLRNGTAVKTNNSKGLNYSTLPTPADA
jgi:membrane fusion protein, multidrug efflux system